MNTRHNAIRCHCACQISTLPCTPCMWRSCRAGLKAHGPCEEGTSLAPPGGLQPIPTSARNCPLAATLSARPGFLRCVVILRMWCPGPQVEQLLLMGGAKQQEEGAEELQEMFSSLSEVRL
jgi:hypothetical protein